MLSRNQKLQRILDKAVDRKRIFGTTFAIEHRGELWRGAAGDLQVDSSFFIASTTKLFITATILHFRQHGRLELDDPIAKHLDAATTAGLHVRKGVDRSSSITIRHLLAHTSGLPDYFGQAYQAALLHGQDRSWTFEEAIAESKKLAPHFAPGTPGKAFYSDTNFQLLGRIIERITGLPLATVLDHTVCTPAGMRHTYLFTDPNDTRPSLFHHKDRVLRIPQAMASFGADGGMVSTTTDMIRFLEHFFQGHFFPRSVLAELQHWNRIFFPMQSGVGLHLFKLPWLMDPTGAVPPLIGHSGLSGALAFHAPKHDLYICGTVDQVAWPGTSFRVALKLVQEVLRR